MSTNNHYISGWNTHNDWVKFRICLNEDSPEKNWDRAYKEFFLKRLDYRYFNPIDILQEHGTYLGEGFSIMTILCSLIEFLESTYQGKIYRYARNKQRLEKYEYSSSKLMFVSFFLNHDPFKGVFDEDKAIQFYESIRCGLLHEAGTKNGWRIWAKSGSDIFIDFEEKIIYRDNFKKGIKQHLNNYRKELLTSKKIQNAFIRKFNSLT